MARRQLVVGSIPSLRTLTIQFLSAMFGVVAGHDLSPAIAARNLSVPDYVTRHAPIVWLHSQDPFRPADLLNHVQHTTPMIGQDPVPDLPPLDLDNLAMLNNVSSQRVALTSNDNVTAMPSWLYGQAPDASGKIENATACVVILVEKSEIDLDAFYFYFYSYDRGPNITQVREPLNRLFGDDVPGYSFGDHVGDWEHNMVRFHDGKPSGIYYSQHRDGAAYDWNDAALTKTDERPLVFSAYGSHANYPSEGDHIHDAALIDHCDAGQTWDPVLSAYFYRYEPSTFELTRLFTSSHNETTASNLTSFLYYTGIWGDEQYPDDDPIQQTVPRFGMKRFVSGPTGPTNKHLVRKGLAPDHPRVKTWLEWAVEVFMAWYPCCIRGWRLWVSLAVVIVSIMLCVLVLLYLRRWYRTRKYTRVETEIPMEEIGRLEAAH